MLLIAAAFLLQAATQSAECAPGANCSQGQSGGISAGTVYFGRPAFELTDALVQQVIVECPKGIPVVIRAVGPMRAVGMQEKLAAALQANGFEVRLIRIGFLVPVPEQPIAIERRQNETVVTIAPNA